MAELRLENLHITAGNKPLLRGVNLTLREGEILALVGASGSGKSLTARTCLGILPTSLTLQGELTLEVDGVRHRPLSEGFAAVAGTHISYLPQAAAAALDPMWTVAKHLESVCNVGESVSSWLRRAGFADPVSVSRCYPHELSGGMAQRVCIALALAQRARFLIADEPTTGLDAPIQRAFLAELARLKATGPGILLITHDLSAVEDLADRIAVMSQGVIIEEMTRLADAQTDTARTMLAEIDRLNTHRSGAPTQPDEVLCIADVSHRYRRGLFSAGPVVVEGADLTVHRGEVVGLIGESGSGKTTLGRLAAGLLPAKEGEITLLGSPLSTTRPRALRALRREVQVLFQSADAHLNPGMTVRSMLEISARLHRRGEDTAAVCTEALEYVGMAGRGSASPQHLSGGERRRIGIARVLIAQPVLLISDEPTTGLDAALKADLLDLLLSSADSHLIISHDLALIAYAADRIAVMLEGRIIEVFPVEALGGTHHPYTHLLLNPQAPVEGRSLQACPHTGPCPHARRSGERIVPSRMSIAEGHWIACYHTGEA